jgi:hypothetical protein
VNSLVLLQATALAACSLAALRQAWKLKSKTTSRPDRLRSFAKIVACTGGVAIIAPVMGGLHGWALNVFIIAAIACFFGYGVLVYAAYASSAEKQRNSPS